METKNVDSGIRKVKNKKISPTKGDFLYSSFLRRQESHVIGRNFYKALYLKQIAEKEVQQLQINNANCVNCIKTK